ETPAPSNLVSEIKQMRLEHHDAGEVADALAASDLYKNHHDLFSHPELIGEGAEWVAIKVKGPIVVSDPGGNTTHTLQDAVLKIGQSNRGEWHESWGNWEERPFDALMPHHEEVALGSKNYDVFLQEQVAVGVSDEHLHLFEKMLQKYNQHYTANSRDDQYHFWDVRPNEPRTNQLGYSFEPVTPETEAGAVWVNVDGRRARVVVIDPWAVKRYGEDGLTETGGP
ncbi:MAG: hypothetical protein ACRD3W_19525, partial [Terriglobales bacterium]